MNKVMLIGRLVRDPDVRYSNNQEQTCVARYTLAVQRNKDEADFIGCVAFGKAGEFVERYLVKGLKVAVVGNIRTGQYKDRDGETHYTTDVVVEQHEFCEPRQDQDQDREPEEKPRNSRRR